MTSNIQLYTIPTESFSSTRSNKRTINQISTDFSTLTELVSDLLHKQADPNREIDDLHEKTNSLKKKLKKLTKTNTLQASVISRLQSEIVRKT